MIRTWGPFTGRQLTTIVVALIIGAVLIPSTVWAVDTFSNVAVEDPVSGTKAMVDSGRHLVVAGNANGAVIARETNLTQLVRLPQQSTSVTNGAVSACIPVAAPPAGKAWVLNDLYVDAVAIGDGPARISIFGDTACSSAALVQYVNTAGSGLVTVPYDNGLATSQGLAFKVASFGAGGTAVYVTASGYQVPASYVPAGT